MSCMPAEQRQLFSSKGTLVHILQQHRLSLGKCLLHQPAHVPAAGSGRSAEMLAGPASEHQLPQGLLQLLLRMVEERVSLQTGCWSS
jgi:hypothetical protein